MFLISMSEIAAMWLSRLVCTGTCILPVKATADLDYFGNMQK